MGFQVVLEVKNPPANTGGVRDLGSVPRSGRFQPTPVFLPGESPWTEEPGGLQSWGPQRVRHDRSDFVHMGHKSDCAGKVVEVILGGVKHAACSWSLLCESEKRR